MSLLGSRHIHLGKYLRGQFDVDASLGTGIFSGVEKSHNAYTAGLRNGMTFIQKVEGGGGDTTRPIVLEVKGTSGLEKISYIPIGKDSSKVPQYVLSTKGDC